MKTMANIPEELQKFFDQAMSFYDSQQWDQAIDAYSGLLALVDKDSTVDPKFKLMVYNSRGLAYSGKGDFDRAIADYSKAIEIAPGFVAAYNNRGLAYSGKGDFDRAIADYDEAIERNPEFVEAYNNRGLAYGKKGNFDLAIANCSKAIELNPNSVVAYSFRGLAYSGKGDFDRAIADFNKAIELDPNIAGAYNSRGIAYINKGDLELAIDDYSKAIEINPNYDEAYHNRGFAYINKGDLELAIDDYSKAIEINPNFVVAYYNRGFVYGSKGNFDLAIADYSKAIKIAPGFVVAHSFRGLAYSSKGDFDLAIDDCSKAIKIDPNSVVVYSIRGLVYNSKGNFDLAIADCSKAIEIDPNSVVAYNTRGLAYSNKGNFDRAIADFNKAIELNPNFADAYHNRGFAHFNKNNFDRAMADFKKTIELQPGYILKSAPCYIVSCVGSGEVGESLLKLYRVIYKIQNILIYKPNNQDANKQADNVVAHYTRLGTLKKLIKGESFRLYNASDMSDPEEGDVFLAIIKNEEISGNAENGEDMIKDLYPCEQNDKNLPSPAYIGSFVHSQEDGIKKEHEDGRLFLWRTYGKDKGREAAGACLHFGVDEFSDSPRSELGAMISLAAGGSRFGPMHASVHSSTHPYLAPGGGHSVPMHVPTSRNCIYRVVYENQVFNKDEKELKNFLKELAEMLKVIKKKYETQQEVYPVVRQIVRAMLDEIRFLFKASHYQEEKELRIVETRYLPEDDRTEGIVELDDDLLPPRFYIKASLPLKLKKVILGPQTRRIKECKCWIVKENKSLKGKVRQSEIKYRDNLS